MAFPDDLNAVALAMIHLTRQGMGRDQAQAALNAEPRLTAMLPLEETRQALRAEVAEAEREAYERSPEGRAEAAKASLVAKKARAELAEGAREVLKSEGNYPASFFENLSDDEALAAAGIEGEPHKGDPYTATNAQGHTFVIDPNDKPLTIEPLTFKQRQAAWIAAENAKEAKQWGGDKE